MSLTIVYAALMFAVFWVAMIGVIWDDNRRHEYRKSLPSAIGWGTALAIGGGGIAGFAVLS